MFKFLIFEIMKDSFSNLVDVGKDNNWTLWIYYVNTFKIYIGKGLIDENAVFETAYAKEKNMSITFSIEYIESIITNT